MKRTLLRPALVVAACYGVLVFCSPGISADDDAPLLVPHPPAPADFSFVPPPPAPPETPAPRTGRVLFGHGINSEAGVIGSVMLDEYEFLRVPPAPLPRVRPHGRARVSDAEKFLGRFTWSSPPANRLHPRTPDSVDYIVPPIPVPSDVSHLHLHLIDDLTVPPPPQPYQIGDLSPADCFDFPLSPLRIIRQASGRASVKSSGPAPCFPAECCSTPDRPAAGPAESKTLGSAERRSCCVSPHGCPSCDPGPSAYGQPGVSYLPPPAAWRPQFEHPMHQVRPGHERQFLIEALMNLVAENARLQSRDNSSQSLSIDNLLQALIEAREEAAQFKAQIQAQAKSGLSYEDVLTGFLAAREEVAELKAKITVMEDRQEALQAVLEARQEAAKLKAQIDLIRQEGEIMVHSVQQAAKFEQLEKENAALKARLADLEQKSRPALSTAAAFPEKGKDKPAQDAAGKRKKRDQPQVQPNPYRDPADYTPVPRPEIPQAVPKQAGQPPRTN